MVPDEFYIDEGGEEESPEGGETLDDVASGEAGEQDYSSLTELSRNVYFNPLNPKTNKNLLQADYLRKVKNDNLPVKAGMSTGRRWTSIQAFNGVATQNFADNGLAETGLIIRVSTYPENAPGWDQVVAVEDVTAYAPANTWAPQMIPRDNSTTTTYSGAGGFIQIGYDLHAFSRPAPYYDFATKNGIFEISLEVAYASGHIENFQIYCPVGSEYNLRLSYGGSTSLMPVFEQSTNICDSKPGFDFYTSGKNWLQSETASGLPYSILTVWGPGISNSSLSGYQMYKYYSGSTISGALFNFINGHDEWNDPFAIEYSFNGQVTPDQNNPGGVWKRKRIDIMSQQGNISYTPNINGQSHSWYTTNFVQGTNIPSADTYFDPTPGGVGPFSNWASNINKLQSNVNNQYFTSTVYYSENITTCLGGPGTTNYDVCATSGNPSYYITTSKDCSSATIPAADLPGGSNYANVTFNHDPACCTDCGDLQILVSSFPATYGTNDGYLQWDATNYSTGSPSGDTWGSGSYYTVAITDSNGVAAGATAAPTGGNDFDDATCDTTLNSPNIGCDSSVRIVPGMQVSGTGIPANSFVGGISIGTVGVNVTQFILVDNMGVTVAATATNTNTTLTFSTGRLGQHGGLAPNIDSNGNTDPANPYYVVCITDELGCKECATITITESGSTLGCTDSDALNYDSNALIDDGSCMKCESSDGLLHDGTCSGCASYHIYNLSGTPQTTSATWGGSAHNSNGQISFSASLINSVYPYVTFDADSKHELLLYKVVNVGDTSTSTGATQIGSTINAGTLLAVGATAAHTWTSLTYGFYSVRVRYVDTNSTVNTEDCWSEFPVIVQAQVCDDSTNSQYTNTPIDPLLRDAQNSILCATSIPCCSLDTLQLDTTTNGTTCEPAIYATIQCDPPRIVEASWEFMPVGGSTWTPIGNYTVGNVGSGTVTGLYAWTSNNVSLPNSNWFAQNGTGYYKVTVQATTAGGDVCYVENSVLFTYPPYGCTDPVATNYDPSAQCNTGCIYPTWDCDGMGNCFDPQDGSGAYTTYNACNQVCLSPPTTGCMDPCAINYNSSAQTDDGSCMYTGCLDNTASNYGYSCNCNKYVNISQIQYNDQSCCITSPCVSNQNAITVTTTDATGDCTTFNADGTALVSVNLTTGATTWTWEIYNSGGSTLIYSDTTIYNDGDSSSPYTTLIQGTYDVTITDNLGCEQTEHFTINSSSPQVGCMDPNADNYDPSAVCDCGCCEICGCMDPNAINFNPNANTQSGCECEYDVNFENPCTPKTLTQNLDKIKGCLSVKGTDWLNKYKVGRADDCTLMNKWKLILINYLLSKEGGLHCLFNCADHDSPPINAIEDCDAFWKTGGRSTGLLHDPAHKGASIVNSGEGTTITVYDGYPLGWFGHDGTLSPASNLTYVGDVVKFDLDPQHPLASWLNGTIWSLTTIPPSPTGMHQGCKNQKIGHYTQCVEYTKVTITTSVNYYDNFINFVNKFCRDCDISIIKELRQ